MNLNMSILTGKGTRWFSAEWWCTPLSPQQGVAGNDFDRPVSLLAMILTGIAGVAAAGLNPVVATAYVDYLDFSEAQAGYVLAADMSGFAIGALLVSARIHIWNRRMVAICGIAILLIGNLACLGLGGFDSMLIARFIIGTGAGSAAGVMAASIAASGSPDRFFGFYTVVTLSIFALLMSLATVRGCGGAGACFPWRPPGPYGADNIVPACFGRLSPGAAFLRQQAGVRARHPVLYVFLAVVFSVSYGYCFGT